MTYNSRSVEFSLNRPSKDLQNRIAELGNRIYIILKTNQSIKKKTYKAEIKNYGQIF